MSAMVRVDGEEYLTGDEAANLLGVKRETLYAYVSRGLLKSYRQGIKRQRLYRRAEIEALLRLAPSSPDEPATAAGARSGRPAEVPLAESWIRD
jgi:citrate synthase